MKKNTLLFSFLLLLLTLTSCSSPDGQYYQPVVIDEYGLLPDSVKQTFENFQFTWGVVPVLVMEDAVDDSLKISAHADEVFNQLEDQFEEQRFSKFGLLIYLTKDPQLMQVRQGSFYDVYSSLCCENIGLEYLRKQQLYEGGQTVTALQQMLTSLNKNMNERKYLSWWQRGQLSGIHGAISDVMEWFGSPSRNFYGTAVAKPVYICISIGNKVFGSWIGGIMLVFVIILLARKLLDKIIAALVKSTNLQRLVSVVVISLLGLIYSFSAAGCAMLFSSGRLEDLYSIKAFGIPNVEAFIANPSMFEQSSSFWLAGLFLLCISAVRIMNIFSNVYVQTSFLPVGEQIVRWNALTSKQKENILGMYLIYDDDLAKHRTPYEAIATKVFEKWGDNLGTILGPMGIAALFFFPKAILWTSIAFDLTSIIFKYPTIKYLLSNSDYRRQTLKLLKELGVIILIFVVISLIISWMINPFDRKDFNANEQQSTFIVNNKENSPEVESETDFDVDHKDNDTKKDLKVNTREESFVENYEETIDILSYEPSQNARRCKLEKVVVSSKETRIYGYYDSDGTYDRIWWTPGSYLLVEGGKRLKLIKSEGVPMSPNYAYIKSGEKKHFVLFFPALPSGTMTFDFIESEADNGWRFLNVKLSKVMLL